MESEWLGFNQPETDRKKYRELARYPERCTECDTKSRRYSRMTASLNKILDIKDDLEPGQKFARPKMITIGNSDDLSKEEFKKRFKKWRDESPWLIGGTYVFEKGSKNGMWHAHGVYIAPYIRKCNDPKNHPDTIDDDGNKKPCACKMKEWSATSLEFGLGRMNYIEAKYSKQWKNSGLCNYIAKYMCKDGNRKQSFAALYRCVQEREQRSDGTFKKIWFQPNREEFQHQMKMWITTEGKKWK